MHEEQRLRIVKNFEQLNLKYDKELQETIAAAAQICQTPISAITIIGKDTQWLKLKKGLDVGQIPRNLSFCTYTIKQERVLMINDTHLDQRFCNNPYVTGGPKIRFYAGYPLVTQEGHRIGALCIMGHKPQILKNQQKLMLKVLAKHAMGVMELKQSLQHLEKSMNDLREIRKIRIKDEIKLRAMFDSLTDAYFLLGINGEIIDFNKSAYQLIYDTYGIKLSYGRLIVGFLSHNYRDLFEKNYKNALNGDKVQLERLSEYSSNGLVWWDCTFEPVKNEVDEIIGVSYLARNINERKLNEEKLKQQNQVLGRIAEIQSHEYRGPVANIIGLMELIQAEDYHVSKDYLIILQKAVKNLDEKICEVVGITGNPFATTLNDISFKSIIEKN